MKAIRRLHPRLLRLFIPAVLFFSLSSCIEITEKLTLSADRSGYYRLSADAGALAPFLMMSGGLDDESLRGLEAQLSSMAAQLRALDGISEIIVDPSLQDGKLSLGFAFTDPVALNRALFALGGMEKKRFMPNMYSIGSNRVTRRNITPFMRQAVKKDFPEWEQARAWIKQVNLNSQCEIPGKVTKSKGKQAKHQAATVAFRWNALDVMEEGASLRYRLRYAPND